MATNSWGPLGWRGMQPANRWATQSSSRAVITPVPSVPAVGLGARIAGQRSDNFRLVGEPLPRLRHLDEKCLEFEIRRLARLLQATRSVLLILFRGLCRQAGPLGTLPNGQGPMIRYNWGVRLFQLGPGTDSRTRRPKSLVTGRAAENLGCSFSVPRVGRPARRNPGRMRLPTRGSRPF